MTARNFDALFAPRSLALIGASDRPGSVGAVATRNLLTGGFSGPIMLVNQRAQTIAGAPVYPSIQALPHRPDLAVIATPAATVPALVAELGAAGCRAAIVISAGFGAPDSALRAQMQAAARPYLLRLLGPNSLGFQSPSAGINASFAHIQPKGGGLALISQSGAVAAALIDWAAEEDIGFSHVVSLGDMTDIDFGDMLDHLAYDALTNAILLYVENVTHAQKFMAKGREATRGKPVIVVKSGRSAAGARAAATHTGALAGADLIYDAAFRQAGMLRVDELGELFIAAEMLANGARVTGDRLAILTNGGGAGVLAVDTLQAAGGSLAPLTGATLTRLDAALPAGWSRANPIDIIGDARAERYRAALEALTENGPQDAILVMNCPTGVADSLENAEAVIAAAGAARLQAPLLTCWLGGQTARTSRRRFAAARTPSFETPHEAVRAFMQLVRYGRNQTLLQEVPDPIDTISPQARATARAVIAAVLQEERMMLTAPEAHAVLTAYAIPSAAPRVATTPAAAGVAAAAIGGRVALKILSPDITHKTDVGGVCLNLCGAAETERAAGDMLVRAQVAAPGARLIGFTVQPMIIRPKAIELLVGINADPTFGPVVLFAAGGVTTEIVADRAAGLPPLHTALARDLIARTRVSKLLAGYRDTPPVKAVAVEDVLIRLSALALDLPEIAALDINPLIADSDGVIALDARIELHQHSTARQNQ
ncbi:MAG: acetate--CoA ligase family protein [Hyphomonadaceae bacterium]